MGGSHHTTQVIVQIRPDPRAQLERNARQQLRDIGGSPGDDDDLNKTVPEIAKRQFRKTYGYEYYEHPIGDGNPEVIPVPKVPELCDVVPPASSQVTCQVNIPDQTIKQKTVNDLYNHISKVVAVGGTGDKWVTSSYNQSYDMTENPGSRSVKCNSTILYILGNFLEDGTRTEIAFICFCGVYYTVDSPTVQVQRDIEQDAYKTAPPMASGEQPTKQEELKASLEGASKADFESNFGFPFSPGDPDDPSSYPPDSYRARGVKSAQFALNSGLHVIPDPKPGIDLESYIDELYMGLNIPAQPVRDQSRKNIAANYDTIIKTSQGRDRSWITDRIDQTLETSAISVNKTRQVAVVRCWYGHETISGDITVSKLFIHIITMVYELEDAEAAQERDLFYILGNQFRKEQESGSDDIPYLQLEEWAEEYARQGFKKKFGFEHQGSASVVPEKGIGMVIPFSSFFRLKRHPVTDEEVLAWIHDTVLSADNRVAARDRIIDTVRRNVVQNVNDGAVRINHWFTAGTPDSGQIFEDKENKGYDMQMRAYYLFVHGKLQVGDNPEPTERVIAFALGVITTWKDPWKSAPRPATASGVAPAKEYIHIPPQRVSA
ncbi:hypothetical protein P691DRAFT_761426 [Macrolepiota fuliginosa MF-IS2]|uniref:Uncharacterized protein n=1 Tax=Macrolepiota fuliginosa MF-IS2 TaxID=1400762 RepID=A0A9P6C0J6_9AGAR|nr:hypothetical protein P691DRAFT_761426 [Macrolepiota fuliginosa MF-IS2]